MKEFKFVHAADLHLDSPFKGISAVDEDLSEELANATFNAFDKVINICIEEEVDFLLVAGDIYDSEDKSLRAQLKFIDGLKRLSEEGIETYVIHGNHDPSNGWASNLEIPQNVHVFSGRKVHKKVFQKDGEDIVEIYGFSYYTKNITESVIPEFEEKVSPSNIFSIGLLHCNLSTSTGHAPYAPCTIRELTSLPINYWALGHIHNKEIIEDKSMIVYPGNTQGRHIREEGERGCYLVEVDEEKNIKIEFRPTEFIRWETRELSVENYETFQDLRNGIYDIIDEMRDQCGETPVICRLKLVDRGPLSQDLRNQSNIEDILKELRENEFNNTPFVWIEKIKVETNLPIDLEQLRDGGDFIGELVKMYDELYKTDEERRKLIDILQPLFDSPRGRKYLYMFSDEELLELIEKAEYLSIDLLLGDNI